MRGIVVLFLIINLYALEGAIVKGLSRTFSKNSIEYVSKRYGDDGLKALANLSKYGSRGVAKLEEISAKYGKDGIRLVAKYGDDVVRNKTTFNLVKRFKDKGYYLIERFPKKSVEYFNKFGDKFVNLTQKYGSKRVIKYLDGASKYGASDKVIRFLDKFGDKANQFLDRHWGKLLASGFVLLNADSLIESMQNVANHAIDKTSDVVENSIKNVANSQFGLLAGIALLLFVFFKYGFDKIRKK